VRCGIVAVGDLADVEEPRAGDVARFELRRRVALVGGHEEAAVDNRQVTGIEVARQPVGGHQIVHQPRPR